MRYPITLFLIIANTVIFGILAIKQQSLMMSSGSDVLAMISAGANLDVLTLDGQPWRIITCMFLHFGILHLAVNMYGLYSLGRFIEPGLGSLRFIILYFICGIVASIASLFYVSYTPGAGASGAIFGLCGYVIAAQVISTNWDWSKLKEVLANVMVFVVINVIIALSLPVDTAAHIGGALTGLIVAVLQFKFRMLVSAWALTILMILLPFSLLAVPSNKLEYYRIFQRVIQQERAINVILKNRSDAALRDSLNEISGEWRQLYFDLKHLKHVPEEVAPDTATLANYISLRTSETDYRIKVLEQSYIYLDSLESLGPRFDSLPPFKKVLNFSKGEADDEPQDDTTQQDQGPTLKQVQVYYDKNWREINDESSAYFYRIGSRDSIDRWQGPVRDFYISGDLQMKGSYKDGLRDGVFIYYSDHKTYESAGRYEREHSVGKWETFHWNGTKESEVFYDNRTFTSMMWDSLGNVQVVNGRGDYKSWYPNGVLKEQGHYYNGQRTGDFLGYFSDGKPYYREYYENNVIVRGVSLGRDGSRYNYDALSELPTPVSGMKKYREYLEKNKRSPLSKNEGGVVKVIFTVGVDGSMWDFLILQGVSAFCDREAIRLIQEGEKWRPALAHGQEKVQGTGYVEVRF
jgi:membrane associated rhomboid family serine protease/antitoxin component YwqK of YwqJK toxin-antitoxin module